MSRSLDGNLEFRLYQPKPGHPDFKALLPEAMDLSRKIETVIRTDAQLDLSDHLKDRLRKSKSLSKAIGNMVINRRRYKKGNHALRPLYAIWSMLNACNFRCTYCDNHQGEHYYDIRDPDRLDTWKSKRLLDVIYTGTPALYWCGGEPTLRNDLPELLDYAWKLGYFPNMINTNGSLLHQRLQKPEWRNFLWQMDIVIMSMDGLDLERLDELWGVKKARQVMINLLMMRELKKKVKFKLSLNTVITPETIEEARSVLDLANDLDVWFVPVPVNYKHEPNRELLDNPDYRNLAELIFHRKKQGYKIIGSVKFLERLLAARPYRCLTALKPHVWSNGEICWPCRASANVEPVNISLLDYGSFDKAYEAGRKYVNPDFFHGPGQSQCGGQCAWAQNYTTARYMDGITDPLNSGFVSELFEFAFNRKNW